MDLLSLKLKYLVDLDKYPEEQLFGREFLFIRYGVDTEDLMIDKVYITEINYDLDLAGNKAPSVSYTLKTLLISQYYHPIGGMIQSEPVCYFVNSSNYRSTWGLRFTDGI